MSMTSPLNAVGVTHFVVFIHGLYGNEKELLYLQTSMQNQLREDPNYQSMKFIFHSAECNLGLTSDGIVNGGQRLLEEIRTKINVLQTDDSIIHLSMFGNSLGGLYARYAMAHWNWKEGNVIPFVFCTVSTPHLGVANYTYVPIPHWTQRLIATTLGNTGQDLFHRTSILQEMGISTLYLTPLGNFRKRIAVANAFGTDFQVSSTTAAFLSSQSEYPHHRLQGKDEYALIVETRPSIDHDPKDMSQCLDNLGWTKIFLDVRDKIPLPSIPLPFSNDASIPEDKHTWKSCELEKAMGKIGKYWKLPFGHMVSCANSRDSLNVWMNANGQPLMDRLAKDFLEETQFSNSLQNSI
jgi:Putative serine esterase (DUF676)